MVWEERSGEPRTELLRDNRAGLEKRAADLVERPFSRRKAPQSSPGELLRLAVIAGGFVAAFAR